MYYSRGPSISPLPLHLYQFSPVLKPVVAVRSRFRRELVSSCRARMIHGVPCNYANKGFDDHRQLPHRPKHSFTSNESLVRVKAAVALRARTFASLNENNARSWLSVHRHRNHISYCNCFLRHFMVPRFCCFCTGIWTPSVFAPVSAVFTTWNL